MIPIVLWRLPEGYERRVMVAHDSTKDKGMKATAIPDEIIKQFAAD